MALFKILKGKASDLPSTYHEGYCYFTTDTGKFYIDISNTNAASSRVELNAHTADAVAWSGISGIPTLVYSVETGTTNGSISVNQGGTTKQVAVKGLAAAAYKGVTDNSSNADVTSSDTNLITGRTLYYQLAKKGYTTNTGTVTSITLTAGGGIGINDSGTAITTSGTRTITNTGVRSISAGSANGTLSVNTNGTTSTITLVGAPYLPLAGGTVTGTTVFNNTVTMNSELAADSATIGNLIVTGAGRFTNGIYGDLTGTASNAPWSGITGKPNSGSYVWDVTTGTSNGNISVNLNGTTKQVAVKGLGDRAFDSTVYIPASQKGAASGVAPLNGSSKIDATYLPSYVDDVLEYASTSSFPTTGTSGIIYLAQDTGFIYRWTGSQYVNISADTNTTYSFGHNDSDANGTIRVTPSTGTSYTVSPKGIAAAAYKGVTDNSSSTAVSSTDTNLITARTLYYAGYVKSSGVTSITLKAGDGISLDTDNTAITSTGTRTITNAGVRSVTTGSANGTISVNTGGTTANVAVKGLGSNAYTSTAYLPLAGGTMTGQIQKESVGVAWVNGREGALVRNTNTTYTSNNYNPIISVKSINGSWDMGTYTANNSLYFTYITDTNYNASTNTTTQQVEIRGSDGKIYATGFVGNVTGTASGNLTNVAYDATNKKITKTINGTTSDIVSVATFCDDYVKKAGDTMTGQLTMKNHIVLQKPDDVTWSSSGGGAEPSIQMIGYNNRAFKFRFSSTGQNVDVGYDWPARDGSGAAFRSTDAGGVVIFYARNASQTSQLYCYPNGVLRWEEVGTNRRVVTATDGVAVGSASTPVYIDASGHAQSITSLDISLNTGVRSVATGSANGTISVNINGTTANVAVKGLGNAAYTDTSYYTPISYMPLRSLRDFTNGTLITTNLSGGTTSSSIPFLLEIKGNGYGNGLVHAYAQGYVYNLDNGYTSYINVDAYSDNSFANKIYAFKNNDGYLCFWFERMAYWQGFDIQCWNTSENINTNNVTNHVTSITNVALPDETNRKYTTEISVRKMLHSSNYTSYTVKKDGTGASGTWEINITGSSASCTGNAATATKLSNTPNNTTTFLRGDNAWSNTITDTFYSNCGGTSKPSFRWNKGGSYWGGIGYHNTSNENWFGPVDSNNAWVDANTDTWHFRGLVKITNHGNTVIIGSQNGSWTHFENSANRPFYFSHQINVNGGFKVYNTSTTLTDNNLTFSQGGGWYMSDSSWIRTVGSKNIYQNSGITRTDGQFQVGDSGSKFYANNSGNGYFSNTLGIAGINTSYNLYINGTTNLNGNTTITGELSVDSATVGNLIVTGAGRFTNGIYGDLTGNASTASALKDKTNGTVTYSNYGAAGLAGSAISWMTCWNGYELRAISKAETFNVVRDNGGDSRWVKKAGDIMSGALNIKVNSSPHLIFERTDSGETSIGFKNTKADWIMGLHSWSVGEGVFVIGQSGGTSLPSGLAGGWRFKIDNNGYCFTRSYLNLGEGNEKNASSPPYVLGFNSSDNYVRSYQTAYLNVNSATKLTSDAGTSSVPVYFSGGKPVAINTGTANYTKTITVTGDKDTYYPVVISPISDKTKPHIISIWKNLGSTTAAYSSGNHSNGTSSMWIIYEHRYNGWDGNGGYGKTWYYSMPYANLVAKSQLLDKGVGSLCIWLRGGTTEYKISSDYDLSVNAYYSATNVGSSDYPVNIEPTTTVTSGGWKIISTLGYGNVDGNASTATSATQDSDGNAINTTYLKKSGGQMTGTLTMTTSPAAASASTPTALSYGRLQAYGTLCINANTDNSGDEYVILTAGKGVSSTAADGLAVGSSTLKWQGTSVVTNSGTWEISITGSSASCTGNAATATTLQTSRTLWGQSFNGSANISGNMINVGPQLKLPSGSNFEFLTSSNGAANGKFGRILISDSYSSGDISNYRFYVNSGNSYLDGTATINGNTVIKGRYWGTSPTRDSGAIQFPNVYHTETTSGEYYRPWLSGSEAVTNKGYGNAWSMGLFTRGANNTDLDNMGYYMGTTWDGSATTSYIWRFTRGGSSYFPGDVSPSTDLAKNLGTSNLRWANIYGNVLRLQGASSNPSASAGARIEFTYDSGSNRLQPVYLAYTPNDSYRAPAGLKIFGGTDAIPAWLEVEGSVYAPTFLAEHINGGHDEFRVTYGSSVDMAMMIGTGNENHGIYDNKANKWMIYADISGNVTVNGNAATATKATQDESGNNIKGNYAHSISISDHTITLKDMNGNSLGTVTVPDNNTTYNFSGTTFYSGSSGTAEHNANNAVKNGNYYYTSNGPSTSLGASTTDGALYVQSYSDSWVGQIAQDYRNGCLFVRGKNNGTWQSWQRVFDTGHTLNMNSTCCPQFSGAPSYLLGIEAFADGGAIKWQATSSISVNYATSAGSATKATQDSDGNAINTTYLKKSGDTMTGKLTLETHLSQGYSTAAGITCFAVGSSTTASGDSCFAEGGQTTSTGTYSHAGGFKTTAQRAYQTVIGAYNVLDTAGSNGGTKGNYAFIIGNGTADDARSNALAVDWDGNLRIKGNIYIGCNADSTGGGASHANVLYCNILYANSAVINADLTVGGTLYQSSDKRLKKHISYLNDNDLAVDFIRNLRPVHYAKNNKSEVGFYAQDVLESDYWNAMVKTKEDGMLSLSYTEIIAPLVSYCQKLEKRVKELEAKLWD